MLQAKMSLYIYENDKIESLGTETCISVGTILVSFKVAHKFSTPENNIQKYQY